MPEAEVSLRLAIYLTSSRLVSSDVQVALDGAQVKTGETQHFDVPSFMKAHGWLMEIASSRWQGKYRNAQTPNAIVVHSQSGLGDVTALLSSGAQLLVEAKKGPLGQSKSSSEYKLLREALGQLLTIEKIPENAVMAVAVPDGIRFRKLAKRWRKAPLIQRSGIKIVTVSSEGIVCGL